MTNAEADRYLTFMKFPNVLAMEEYQDLLEGNGCRVKLGQDTGRFSGWMPLYLDMLEKQLTYDALKLIGFDTGLAETLLAEMRFIQTLAQAGKVMQGIIIAELK